MIPTLIGLVAARTHIRRGFTVAVASSVVFLVLTIVHYQFAMGQS